MARYFRVYELFGDEKVYFNGELEPCDREKAYLFSKVIHWMEDDPGVVIEWCPEDEQMRLNGAQPLPLFGDKCFTPPWGG